MIRQIALLELGPHADAASRSRLEDALREVAPKLPGLVRTQLGRHPPGTVGGGDYTWDAWLDESAPLLERWLASEALRGVLAAGDVRIDAVRFRPGRSVIAEPRIARPIKRTLLLRVLPDTPPERIAQFDADMVRMPDHIAAIRNWAYAHTDPALQPTSWTHVWEQEYERLEGLQVDYMMSAYHWGYIDRYFDVESGLQIVDARLAHVFYRADGPGTILAPPA